MGKLSDLATDAKNTKNKIDNIKHPVKGAKEKVKKSIKKKILLLLAPIAPILFIILLICFLVDAIISFMGFNNVDEYTQKMAAVEQEELEDNIQQLFETQERFVTDFGDLILKLDYSGNQYPSSATYYLGNSDEEWDNLPIGGCAQQVYLDVNTDFEQRKQKNTDKNYAHFKVNNIRDDFFNAGLYKTVLGHVMSAYGTDEEVKSLLSVSYDPESTGYDTLYNKFKTFTDNDINWGYMNAEPVESSEKKEAVKRKYYQFVGSSHYELPETFGEKAPGGGYYVNPKSTINTSQKYYVDSLKYLCSPNDSDYINHAYDEKRAAEWEKYFNSATDIYTRNSKAWELREETVSPETTETTIEYKVGFNTSRIEQIRSLTADTSNRRYRFVDSQEDFDYAEKMLKHFTGDNYETDVDKSKYGSDKQFNDKFSWRDTTEPDPEKVAAIAQESSLLNAYRYFTETCGYTKEASCVLVTEIEKLSNFNPKAEFSNAYGILKFKDDDLKNLRKYAADTYDKYDVQLKYINYLFTEGQPYTLTGNLFRNSDDFEQIIKSFNEYYLKDKNADVSGVLEKAKKYAENIELLLNISATKPFQKLSSEESAVLISYGQDEYTRKQIAFLCSKVGMPYVYGGGRSGDSPNNQTSYDCSSLAGSAVAYAGIEDFPWQGTTDTQPAWFNANGYTNYISAYNNQGINALQPGDLIYNSHHVVTYIGGGLAIHASCEEVGIIVGNVQSSIENPLSVYRPTEK